MYVYQRLKDIREDSDKKQEDIALVLNITRQQYQLYESGKREMPMHHFVTLAKYYNMSLDYLAGLIDKPKNLFK
ncbi:MAG: helix-turn-helix transcriptional regulator [Clostridia bacterium]|nr:helix-turn-helix transcriptional regulator [Clostridia bacterium]